tara:strand:- start:391 stop:606 length:216 start_codon:yes stop_codon:yes gene_type:complete
MGYLQTLRRANISSSERWFLKYNDNGLIREVKQVYNATEYRQINNARKLLTKKKLIEALEKDKTERENNAS